MKNRKTFLPRPFAVLFFSSFIFACLSLSSCASFIGGLTEGEDQGGIEIPPMPDAGTNSVVSFAILQLNDVYEIAPLEKGKVGGMARVASLRQQLLAENYNVFTVLAGDFLSPSLIGTLKYEGERIKGRQMVEVMNALGVNMVTFGNHEFDVKEEELQARLNESYFEWLSTNVLHKTGSKVEPFYKDSWGYKYFLPETYIWEVMDYMTGNPVRVGFYSATLSDNQQDYVYYEDPYQEATKAYLELTGKADIIIGLTHLELEQDMKLAATLPKTALIMGGHEHENSLDSVGNVVIAKADANAKTVWVHRFNYLTDSKTWELYSDLVPITDEMAEDSLVAGIVARWQNIQHEQISQIVSDPEEVIFSAYEPLDGREKSVRTHQTNLGEIIATAMAASAKRPVEAAFFNGGSIRLDDQLSGDVTAVDIFRAMPFGGGIYEVEMKGSLLKKSLNAGMENKGLGGYLQWYNIEFDEKNKNWKIGGKPLSESKVYRVAVGDYVFSGKENRLEFLNKNNKDVVRWDTAKEGDNTDLRSDVRKAVVAYLKTMNK
jgi:2',3'-cyclic-nucleotide 2'-phosphodiesterase (5'-nucleotidase family)